MNDKYLSSLLNSNPKYEGLELALTKFLFVIIAPFSSPYVPEVYIIKQVSSPNGCKRFSYFFPSISPSYTKSLYKNNFTPSCAASYVCYIVGWSKQTKFYRFACLLVDMRLRII